MYYTFQQSKIWEAGDPVDSRQPRKRIKGKTEQAARKKLGKNDMGRKWVLVATDEKPIINTVCPACKAPAEQHMMQDGTVYCSDAQCGFMGQLPEEVPVS